MKKDTFAALRGLMTTNAIIRNRFATVPFMLNTMAYVTRGESAESLRRLVTGKDNEASLRAAFLDEYVTQRLDEKPNAKYSNAKTRHWLRWLAGQLIKHDETDFYLENMQPDWLANLSSQRLWVWSNSIVLGLFGGLAVGLIFGLAFGLVLILLLGVVVGLVDGRMNKNEKIKMSDQLIWSLGVSDLLSVLVYGLLIGMLSGLGVGLFGGLVSGLVAGLVGGLVGGPISVLIVGLNSQSLLRYRVHPGHGIQRSLRNGLVGGLIGGVVVALVFGLLGNLLIGMVGGLVIGLLVVIAFGLVFGLESGLRTFIQHYLLHWILARQGNLPFYRYDKFLDYANDLVILRKVGGGYRFTHDMLRQHLAGTSTPKAET